MSKVSMHVAPNPDGGWSVTKSSATRASRVFATQLEAIAFGRYAAKKAAKELYVHGIDGTIRYKSSYGQAPMLAGDKK